MITLPPPIPPYLLPALVFSNHSGYLAICFAIEYAKTFPKLLGWLNSDPKAAEDSGDCSAVLDDEDVAAEARRVERMGGLLGEDDGEVVLRGLRKVYRTKQARRGKA